MALKIHKLTKKEAQKISNYYNLGKVISIKLFEEGLVNSNYKLTTEKGDFVIRFLGKEPDKWKKEMLELEKKVLFHLKKKKFPYKIPIPLRNKKKKYLSTINKRYYWIYKMIPGEIEDLNEARLKELAKAVATYYKYIKDLKIKVKKEHFQMGWFIEQYEVIEKKLAKIKNPNKTDQLMKDNFEFFKDLVHKLDKIDFKYNMIAAHGDIHKANVLFKGDKLIGMIDFDNIKIAPRVEDLAYALRLSTLGSRGLDKKGTNTFIKEYEKYVKLTKKEKSFIIPLIIRDNSIVFWWMYMEMKKGQDKKYDMIKWTIDSTKALVKDWEGK
jgi:homoserine kinase type II